MINVEIISLMHPREAVLHQKSAPIAPHEFDSVTEIEEQLHAALEPYFPAAGLAAPQIGISKAVFIYRYDRDPAHLETVVNPTFTPLTDEQTEGWEGCLSVINSCHKIAKVPRYTSIRAVYYTPQGVRVEKTLEGFAAKAFQHEYDHLQGILNVTRPDAEIKEFESKEAMQAFLSEVKKQDAARYTKPNLL